MDTNGIKWTKMDKKGQKEMNKMDNNEIKWTKMNKMDENGIKWTTMK